MAYRSTALWVLPTMVLLTAGAAAHAMAQAPALTSTLTSAQASSEADTTGPVPRDATGPGFGNLDFEALDLAPGTPLAVFDKQSGTPRGKGFVAMHRGYLLVPFSNDGGGGGTSGGFAFFDVSDPRRPKKVFSTLDEPTRYHVPGSPDYVGNLREPHGYSFSSDVWCMTSNKGPSTGLQFWDLSDVRSPRKLSDLALPVMSGGDYDSTPWWVFWQGGRYAYVAGTSTGLHIVDATNPAAPTLVRRIPVPALAGFRVNTVFAVGNLLAISNADLGGMATFDISDPARPELIARTNGQVGYSSMVSGGLWLGAHNPARIYDLRTLELVATAPKIADKGGYGLVQDRVFHFGSSTAYAKLSLDDFAGKPLLRVERAGPSDDWDFGVPLGNCVFVGNDHGASRMLVHDPKPDSTPPRVTMVDPQDGATGVAVTSRVGLTFSDQLLTESIDAVSVALVRIDGDMQIPCRVSNQTGIVNLWPDAPLTPGSEYEVRVRRGGVRDTVGNALAEPFTSRFRVTANASIAITAAGPARATLGPDGSVTTRYTLNATGSMKGQAEWSLEGAESRVEPDGTLIATFDAPGHYLLTATGSGKDGSRASSTRTVTITEPAADLAPASSSSMALEPRRRRLWVACPDQDAVVELDAGIALKRKRAVPVGAHPDSVAIDRQGSIWVTCRDDDTVHVLQPKYKPDDPQFHRVIALPYGSRPRGIIANGDEVLAVLQGRAAVARFPVDDPSAPRLVPIDGDARGRFDGTEICRLSDGSFAIARRRSPDSGAVLYRLSAALLPLPSVRMRLDEGPDSEDSGRGLPTGLGRIGVAPSGNSIWVPARKANIERGLARDGEPLGFESTVRTMTMRLDLVPSGDAPHAALQERTALRRDFNDRDSASAAVYSKHGDYAFVAFRGSDTVQALDAASGRDVGGVGVGAAPTALVLSPSGESLYVHNFLDRTVTELDVTGFLDSVDTTLLPRATARLIEAPDQLQPDVLAGKRIFYRASDPRMSLDGYLSCATCHQDGGHDGRTWDFTDRGEGLRNTTSLRGRRGTGHGPLHWTANFDEVQDFEHDIRGAFGGTGFLDAEAIPGALEQPKAGASPELDALAAYLESLDRYPRSPFRTSDGLLTDDGTLGRAVFDRLECSTCHGGPDRTDSATGKRHDVGTTQAASGSRIGAPIDGFDTPTLNGIWATAPYFHDGSAATLDDVLRRSGPLHGSMDALSAVDRQRLVSYLLQLDRGQ